MADRLQQAVLLTGPTGAGKTPLGNYLEANGLWGKCCLHFDFGTQLRAVGEDGSAALSPAEELFVAKVLTAGALLEDAHFPIAQKILEDFLRRQAAGRNDLLILNGLPRHLGQAEQIGSIVRMVAIVVLVADVKTTWSRLRTNAGGDREGRVDDSESMVLQKLEAYRQRTVPMLAWYKQQNVPIFELPIRVQTRASDLAEALPETPPYSLR